MVLLERIFSENAATSKVNGKNFILIIGGGPAGLMAAHAAASHGHPVLVCDAMPSVGRKLLMAGRGGLNLTHSEDAALFRCRYGAAQGHMAEFLTQFGPEQVMQWCRDLNIPTFVGSSGRVFPTDFKAAPLLRQWIRTLRAMGVKFAMRHRWVGWNDRGEYCFDTPAGSAAFCPGAAILALGGGSWPHLGSDGLWLPLLQRKNIQCRTLQPANCGFDVAWSDPLKSRFAGAPLKSVVLTLLGQAVKGDLMLTEYGIEGSPVYALSAPWRDAIAAHGPTLAHVDLCPDRPLPRLIADLSAPRGSRSLSNHLKRCLNLPSAAIALLHEGGGKSLPAPVADLAALIKAVPILAQRPRPLAEAISSAGGVAWDNLDSHLQVRSLPGMYVAGEMLDWEAPTGGYLLTGCLSTGFAAGTNAALALTRITASRQA